jgi:hypothetical protein
VVGSLPEDGGSVLVQPELPGQQACQSGDHGAVGPVQRGAGDLAAQDGDLVPEHQDLCALPLTGADRDAGYWWELSMRQIETSRTLVFDEDVHARAFFEALLCDNMDLGRPENVELLFRRGQPKGRPALPPPGGGFKTTIDRYCHMVTINVFYKNSRVKQYLKDVNIHVLASGSAAVR